jgi:hyperosmotically inducible protein
MQININRILSVISVALLAVSMTGCESTKKPKDERSAGRALDDKNITENVKKAFENEQAFKLNSIEISTFAGVVSLGGFVNVDDQKVRAQQLAESVPGVRAVSNGITLKPTPQMAPTGSKSERIYSEPVKPVQNQELVPETK